MTASDLLTRGIEEVVPRDLAEKKLLSGKKIRIYLGIDPTGSKLHLGHSVPLRKLQAFAAAGHEVIFLVGSFTAMIGDPSGRDALREPLTKEQVIKNFETYKQQAAKVLDFAKVKIVYNHEWLEKLKFDEIVNLANNFTVQQMLERDMFQLRRSVKIECPNCHKKIIYRHNPLAGITIKDNARLSDWSYYVNQILTNEAAFVTRDPQNLRGQMCDSCNFIIEYFRLKASDISSPEPIGLHEFFYPVMVGYDSVMLDVDCELGGSDQLFNMLAGRTLQQKLGKRDKFVLTTKLIGGTDGRKMSKTYDNCIWLEDSAADMYGKIMSIEDKLITNYMECCTDIPMDEIIIIEKKMIQEENPMQFKKQLAEEIVRIYHGDAAATQAAEGFSNVFAKGELPEDIPEVKAQEGESLLDVLLRAEMITSKSDGRRLLEQGGIHLGDVVISNNNAPSASGTYKVGKRKFLRIII